MRKPRLFKKPGIAIFHACGLLAMGYIAFPLVVIMALSITQTEYLRFPPEGFTLRWYAKFLGDPSYVRSIVTSAELAGSAALIATALGVPCAYVLARTRFPGREALISLFLLPLIVPSIVMGVAILQLTTMLGFARTFAALLVVHVLIVLPYLVRTTLAALSNFPVAVEEAARDLGASGPVTFFLVTLPMIKPGIIAGVVFAIIISWIDVEVSIFGSSAGLVPIPVKLFNYIQYNVDPMIAAVSGASILVAVVIVVLLDLMIGIDKAALISGR